MDWGNFGGKKMSRTSIWLLVCLYFVAAMIFGAFEFIQNHPSRAFDGASVGAMIGGGLVVFVGGGVLPMLGWAIARFRASRAVAPLLFWLLIGCGLAFLSDYGNRYERNSKIQKLTSNEALTGKDRDDMVRSTKQTCVQNQTANPLTPKLGIPANKITAYCDCFAEGMASAILMDEIKVLISTGKVSPSLMDKNTSLGNSCSQLIFAK
jgi:hypothetical protein